MPSASLAVAAGRRRAARPAPRRRPRHRGVHRLVGSGDAVRGDPRPRAGVRAAAEGRADRVDRRRRADHGAQRQRSRRQGRRDVSRSGRCATTAACRRSPICSPTTAKATRPKPRSTRWRASRTRQRAAVHGAACEQDGGASRAARSKGSRGSAIASQLPAIQAVIDKERESQRDAGRRLCVGAARQRPRPTRCRTRSPGPALREQAKRYLIEIAPGRTTTFAHQLLDSDPQIRVDVIDALGLAGDPAAISRPRAAHGGSRSSRSRAPPSARSRACSAESDSRSH